MKHRILVLLRHGQTAWNAERRGQGHHDVPLDDTGHAQAAAVAPALAALAPVALWSSDLSRAHGTAAHVAAATGLQVHTDPRLREFDLGRRTGLTMPEFEDAFPDEYLAFRQGRYGEVPGAESTAQVTDRVCAALREILDSLEAGECAVVVSHGAALKVSAAMLLDWPVETSESLAGMDNCGWSVLDDSGHDGTLRLLAWNRVVTSRSSDVEISAPGADFTSASGVG